MSNPRGRRHSLISSLVAGFVIVLALVGFAVMRVASLFRTKYVPISQLKFPVLVVQPGGAAVFAEWDSTALEKFSERSVRTPVDGTVIIDSAFNQFTQVNVKRPREGDLKQIARLLVPGALRVKYTFDLRRASASGWEALSEMIRLAPPFSDDATEDAAMRLAAQQHPTMDGVLEALHFYKPVEPATQPMTESAVDPTATDESNPATTEPEPGMR